MEITFDNEDIETIAMYEFGVINDFSLSVVSQYIESDLQLLLPDIVDYIDDLILIMQEK